MPKMLGMCLVQDWVGPHGDDLITISSQTNVQLFMPKYGGTKILRMNRFTSGLIKYLDMY